MYFAPPFKLRTLGRGRMTDRNATQLPPGSARDSLNLLHNRDVVRAKTRRAINRAHNARPANAVGLGFYEHIPSSGTSYILEKYGTVLYTWNYPIGTALTSLITGMHSTHQPQFATAGNYTYISDKAANYFTDGTSTTARELQGATTGTITTGGSAGTAVGNTAATITYWITDYDPTTGEERVPATGVTRVRAADEGVTLTSSGLSFAAPYTRKRVYRNRAGDAQPYLVGTFQSSDFPYTDNTLDTALTTVSTVHDENGVISVEKPEAAQHVVHHRGRIFFANLTSALSDVRWSRLGEYTQYENFTYARRSVAKNDGTHITGLVSFRGSLVIFKTRSIYVMNGADNQTTFEVQLAVQGIGCRAHRTIAVTENDIYFLAENGGVYAFNLSAGLRRVSKAIDGDLESLAWNSRADAFCAGYDGCERQYLLSASPSGASTNTKTHVLFVETGAWGRYEFGMGRILPSCYGYARNADGDLRLFFGSTNGYAYETNAATGADGVPSGTKTATVTAGDATTVTAGAASFYALEDDLLGIPVTIIRVADGTSETQTITANSGTVITVASWTTTPAVGDTIYVGAIQATLHLNRMDFGTTGYKAVNRLDLEWEKQSHTIALQAGYTMDGDTAPTATTDLRMDGGYRGSAPVFDRGVGMSIYLNIIGTDATFDLLAVEVPFRALDRKLPAR